MRRQLSVVRRALPVGLALGLWYALAIAVEAARGIEFPTPWEAGRRLAALLAGTRLSGHLIYRHLFDSLLRWSVGFGLAALAGTAVGVATGWWSSVRTSVGPLLQGLQLIPGLAWIPVALLVFGVGEAATIAMIAVTAFTPIAISVSDGVRRVDTTYLRAARMLGAGRRALFVHVLLPGALPALVTGLRLGLGNGWRVLVAAEMVVGTGTGLGYSIIEARWTLDYTSAFACVGAICAIGLLLEYAVFAPLEARTVKRWMLARDTQ